MYDAFSKGEVLFASDAPYMVHASRREKPGMAEIHTKDADIIHVLEGTATLITGGTSVDSKPIAADEFRGSAIVGGETRRLVLRNVIINPAGVQHRFKDTTDPFQYFVVKAR